MKLRSWQLPQLHRVTALGAALGQGQGQRLAQSWLLGCRARPAPDLAYGVVTSELSVSSKQDAGPLPAYLSEDFYILVSVDAICKTGETGFNVVGRGGRQSTQLDPFRILCIQSRQPNLIVKAAITITFDARFVFRPIKPPYRVES